MALLTRRLALLVLLLTAALACSNRERTNPLDPKNPDTDGIPWELAATAGDQAVDIGWQTLDFTDLAGFRLARALGAGPESTLVELPPSHTAYRDSGLANGIDYHYRLVPLLGDGRSLPADGPLTATPGPQVAWAVDLGRDEVVRLAPDGRGVADRVRGFLGPTAVAVASATGRVWIAETFRRRVVALDRSGEEVLVVEGFESPEAISVAPDGQRLWVADEAAGVVSLLSGTGLELGRAKEFGAPADVAVNASDGSAWVADSDRGELSRLDDSLRVVVRVVGLGEPLGLAAVPADTSCWVSVFDRDEVLHIARDGRLLARIAPVPRPIGLALDKATGDLWVGSFTAGTVERYRELAGGKVERIAIAAGFRGPIALASDPIDGGVWVADQVADAVVKLDAAGEERGRTSGYGRPFDVDVDPEGGRASR
jgi:DNA-binding beta-propeller fold protein YncE